MSSQSKAMAIIQQRDINDLNFNALEHKAVAQVNMPTPILVIFMLSKPALERMFFKPLCVYLKNHPDRHDIDG